MGWEDRPYYREGRRPMGNSLLAILNGSVPLFTAFGIRVRAHAWLIIFIVLTILFDWHEGYGWAARAESMTVLFAIVLLHEFGHCFAARWVGGTADDILMWPLGGLAFAQPPHRWLPSLITFAGGPAVNVAICLITGSVLLVMTGMIPWNPFHPLPPSARFISWLSIWSYVWWIYNVSYILLLFNLLPIYPLDGGQILQAALWPFIGFHKSIMFATTTGMVGAVILGALGVAQWNFFLVAIAITGFITCRQRRIIQKEMGPSEYQDAVDYSASLYSDVPKRRKISRRAIAQAQKLARQEADERRRIDAILAKVSAHGMQSLNWFEKRALRKATEHQRQRDLELSKLR